MIGESYICKANKNLYTIVSVPFMGTGLTYFVISDGINNYFVSNGKSIFENGDYSKTKMNFIFPENDTYFKAYNNKILPEKVKSNKNILFVKETLTHLRKRKIKKLN